jgi:hypothetical protein
VLHIVFDRLLQRLLLCAVQRVALKARARHTVTMTTLPPPAASSVAAQPRSMVLCVSRHGRLWLTATAAEEGWPRSTDYEGGRAVLKCAAWAT